MISGTTASFHFVEQIKHLEKVGFYFRASGWLDVSGMDMMQATMELTGSTKSIEEPTANNALDG